MGTVTVVAVGSSSSPGKSYRVWVGSEGPEFCECPAFRLHRGQVAERPRCKHMNALGERTLDTARAIAARPQDARRLLRDLGGSPSARFSFLEVQTEVRGTAIADLRRFSNLEVE